MRGRVVSQLSLLPAVSADACNVSSNADLSKCQGMDGSLTASRKCLKKALRGISRPPREARCDVFCWQSIKIDKKLTLIINDLPSQIWQKTSQFGDINGNTKISLGIVVTKLNNRIIERAKPSIKDKYIADGDGLFLRVMPNGTKTFCFRYTFGEKRRRLLSLGPVPLLSLEDARERATEARKLVFTGKDPLVVAEEAKRPISAGDTVAKLIENWTERYAKKTYKRLDTQLQMVQKDILPVIGAVPVKEVNKKHVSQVINRIIDRGAKVKANRVLSLLKTIFGYAAEHGEISETPVTMTRKGAGGREKPKRRVLTPAEIKTFWVAVENHDGFMTWRTKSILRLILLTAQRPLDRRRVRLDNR